MNSAAENKARLRQDLKAHGKSVAEPQRFLDSSALCKRIRQQREWLHARSILIFAPLPGEPDIWALAQESLFFGREVFLPRFDEAMGVYHIAQVRDLEKDLRRGKFGVREPAPEIPRSPIKQLDLMLVPGLGFGLDGSRLGRGGGHYDRLLSDLEGAACGVAFDWQIISGIPMESHDFRMNLLVTPTLWHVVNQRRGVSR